MAYSVQQILQIAEISEYIARTNEQKGSLFGQRISPYTSTVLYMERKGVQYIYDNDPTDSTLTQTAWYLYSLCRGYNLKASNILNGGSGGSVSPVTPTIPPVPYQFIVAASGNLINAGESSVTISAFIGFNLLFARNGIPQSTVTTESSYYSWSKETGLFTITGAAIVGELFQIYAI